MKAKKRLGQNFLQDQNVLQKIIEAGEISENDLIIEIGAGRGALTEELIKHAGHVQALEIDDDLIPGLKVQFAGTKNLEIIHEDVLNFTPPSESYKVIANIPYYITSPIIRHFLHRENKPSLLILLIQKEVAQKICSKEGSILSLMIKAFSDPEIVCTVPKTAFKPQPKVESAVLKLTILKQPRIKCDFEKFLKLIKIAFSSPRKTLVNNLANGLQRDKEDLENIITSLNLDPKIRPQKLTFGEWEKLLETTL
jgi:16S rRNA (adenine1518-N6/adenine1519-N6)-dimethyltransferase